MLFIKNGYVKTMAGANISGGYVRIDNDGRIRAMGAESYMTFIEGRIVYHA